MIHFVRSNTAYLAHLLRSIAQLHRVTSFTSFTPIPMAYVLLPMATRPAPLACAAALRCGHGPAYSSLRRDELYIICKYHHILVKRCYTAHFIRSTKLNIPKPQ